MPVIIAQQLSSFRTAEKLALEMRAAAASGFEAVSIPAAALTLRAPTVLEALHSSGLRVAAVVESAGLVAGGGADERRETLEALQALLPSCPPGATLILPLADARRRIRFEERQRAALETLRALRFDAERHGVRIALSFDRALDAIAAETVRELIDQANSYWVGCELVAGADDFREPLAILTHRVAAVRLDGPGAAPASVTAALGAIDYDGVLILPPGSPAPSIASGSP